MRLALAALLALGLAAPAAADAPGISIQVRVKEAQGSDPVPVSGAVASGRAGEDVTIEVKECGSVAPFHAGRRQSARRFVYMALRTRRWSRSARRPSPHHPRRVIGPGVQATPPGYFAGTWRRTASVSVVRNAFTSRLRTKVATAS
jgi:hypothetical protein